MPNDTPATVRVTRHFEFSAERVFDAWLDPHKVGRWLFTTPTSQIVRVQIDARVGGGFLIVDRRGGEDVEHTGEYLELDSAEAPGVPVPCAEVLAYSHASRD